MRSISVVGPGLVAFSILAATFPPGANARRRRPPRRAAAPPMAVLEGPFPSTGTLRPRITAPRPIRLQGPGSRPGVLTAPRISAKRLAASDPRRKRARRAALALLARRGGARQVAVMAAANAGVWAEEAARILARKTTIDRLRILGKDKDSRVRHGVARALAHRPRFGPMLVTELLTDRNLRVVRAAVHTADLLGSNKAVGFLATLALRYDRSIRAVALRVLARHGHLKVARRTVIEALTHSRASAREDAVVAVGLARAVWARYFVNRLGRDRSIAVRCGVARALGRLPVAPSTGRILGRLARDRSRRVRQAVRLARADLRRAHRARRALRQRGARSGGGRAP